MRYLLFLFVFISSTTLAQNGINYQGAATDSDGAKLADQNISLRTSILQGGVDGTTSYSETHNTTSDQFGLFNVVIGQGEVVSGVFDSISWGADAHFLKVELDATGGSDYSLVSTTQMMSVPYAKYADNSGLDTNLILEILETSSNDFPQFYLECVDMGLNSGGCVWNSNFSTCQQAYSSLMNLSQDAILNDHSLDYCNVSGGVGDGNCNIPSWRKYKVHGLKGQSSIVLRFKNEEQSFTINTQSINGEHFIYLYSSYVKYAAGSTLMTQYIPSEEDIYLAASFSIITITSYFNYTNSSNYNNLEIFYEYENNWINTGIFYER